MALPRSVCATTGLWHQAGTAASHREAFEPCASAIVAPAVHESVRGGTPLLAGTRRPHSAAVVRSHRSPTGTPPERTWVPASTAPAHARNCLSMADIALHHPMLPPHGTARRRRDRLRDTFPRKEVAKGIILRRGGASLTIARHTPTRRCPAFPYPGEPPVGARSLRAHQPAVGRIMTQPPSPFSSPDDAHRSSASPPAREPFDPLFEDDEELSEELTPEDEMWLAITDYVSGHATAEEAAAVEARMAEDPGYAKLVAEVRAIWSLPFDRILTGKGAAPAMAGGAAAPLPPFEAPMVPEPTAPQAGWRQHVLWGAIAVAVGVAIAVLVIRMLGR